MKWASIPFYQFYEDRNYRLVIMRESIASNQIDIFSQDCYKYRSILTNDWQKYGKRSC